jgi:thiamine biosynthesis lipoprotein
VWGNRAKYWPSLTEWWKEARNDEQWAASITRATRPAGQHRIAWDGLDDQGKPVPPGSYTIVLEARREHGGYSLEKGVIECGRNPATGSIPAAAEFDQTRITYGPAPR